MTTAIKQPSTEQLTSEPLTSDYKSWPLNFLLAHWQQRPPFGLMHAEAMLFDAQVWFGICIRNAPLMSAEVKVKGPHKVINQFVDEQWRRIWSTSASKLLAAKYFGFSGYEATYKLCKGRLEFDEYLDLHPRDVRPVTQGAKIAGVNVYGNSRGVVADHRLHLGLRGMKGLWLSHEAKYRSNYGTSALEHPFDPYWEKTMKGGAYDLRRLRMVKDAWIGDFVRYPDKMFTLPDGNKISGRDIVQEMIELRASGGLLAFPSTRDDKGNFDFEYQPPQSIAGSEMIQGWVDNLDDGIFKGLEIPKEVVEAAASGSGYSGRSIPMMMFLSLGDKEFRNITRTVKTQTLEPLVARNYGNHYTDFDLDPVPLLDTIGSKVGGEPEGGPIGGNSQQTSPPAQLGQNGYRQPIQGQTMQFSAEFDEDEHPRDDEGKFVEVTGDELGTNLSDKDRIERTHEFFENHLRNKVFVNADTGKSIKVSRRGVKKSIAHLPDATPMMAIAKLPEILAAAKYERSQLPRNKEKNVKMFHVFSMPLRMRGQDAQTQLKIREDNNGHWYYDQHVTKKTRTSPISQSAVPKGQTGLAAKSSGRSIDDTDEQIKQRSEQFSIADEPGVSDRRKNGIVNRSNEAGSGLQAEISRRLDTLLKKNG